MQETLAELDSDHIPSNNSLIKVKPNLDIFSTQIKTNLKKKVGVLNLNPMIAKLMKNLHSNKGNI
ncbi:Reverse transcriptase domain-containing protein [Aphis craccivora]|uniref:Reverse transcriptase domain-containing protein n=1 Tax=Aphis craccivora TaxID=307492 RepID=A0A6G0Z2Q7_APHCR|nr:Reverse transcriptase domain-containing protein [Aphis craccivora]